MTETFSTSTRRAASTIAFAASVAAGMIAATPAQAQSCRFAESASTGEPLCVCQSNGRWRISPDDACRAGAAPRTTARPAAPRPALPSPAERTEFAKLQWALDAAGCAPGVIDGLPGPKSRAAMSCLQQAAGDTPTGALSSEERSALEALYDAAADREGLSGGSPIYDASARHPAKPAPRVVIAALTGEPLAKPEPEKGIEETAKRPSGGSDGSQTASASQNAGVASEAVAARESAKKAAAEKGRSSTTSSTAGTASSGATTTSSEKPEAPVIGSASQENSAAGGAGSGATAPAETGSETSSAPVDATGEPVFEDAAAFCASQASFYKDGAAPFCLIVDYVAAETDMRLDRASIADTTAACAAEAAPLAILAKKLASAGPVAMETIIAERLDVSDASRADEIARMMDCAGLGYGGANTGAIALGAEIALAGLGHSGGREMLGWRLAHGVGVPRDDLAGADWLFSAADGYAAGETPLAMVDRDDPAASVRAAAETIDREGANALLAFP